MKIKITIHDNQLSFCCPYCSNNIPINNDICPNCDKEIDRNAVVSGLSNFLEWKNVDGEAELKTAIEKLKAIRGTVVIDGFIDLFCRRACDKIGAIAAEVISDISDQSVIRPLIAEFKKRGAFGTSIHDVALTHNTKEILRRLVDKLGGKLIIPLIEMLEDSDHRIRNMAVDFLHEYGDQVVEPLIPALESKNANMRSEAIRIFKPLMKSVDVEGRLVQMAQFDENNKVRLTAVAAIGWSGDPKIINVLTSIAKSDRSLLVRTTARKWLKDICKKQGIQCPRTKQWWQFWR